MSFMRVSVIAVLLWSSSAVSLGDQECSAEGECSNEESSLLALRSQQESESRRRLPPKTCLNRHGAEFQCAGGDECCGDVCVGRGDVCCENAEGYFFPCQGSGGGCCGNACYAPGSKCCVSPFKPKRQWYPVSRATECTHGFWPSGFWPTPPPGTQQRLQQQQSSNNGGAYGREESSLLASRSQQESESRRRLPPKTCLNRHGAEFQCAG